ncbi:MAG: helix-turn-helix transcriptional regulator [Deltaproteobacteria bacterium]|nr:helix-turn-helix transcriptional regulator [Deltaproteobacteria bacterium]
MKRGRPKGRSRDNRSFGPLGDVIRKHRLEKRLGLLDVAKACDCSVQFISNIEHGRAPLPWEKVGELASFLKIPLEELQAANLAIRSDFRSFVSTSKGAKGNRVPTPAVLRGMKGTASAMAFTARDTQLQEVIQKYQSASDKSRKRFVRQALKLLATA